MERKIKGRSALQSHNAMRTMREEAREMTPRFKGRSTYKTCCSVTSFTVLLIFGYG